VQTIPGKGWFVILRLDSLLEAWFQPDLAAEEIKPYNGEFGDGRKSSFGPYGLCVAISHGARHNRSRCWDGAFNLGILLVKKPSLQFFCTSPASFHGS